MLARLPARLRLAPIEPWQRAQYLVVLTVALTHVSFDLTQPFVPLYIRTLGVTDLSEASIWSGLIVGISQGGYAFAPALFGVIRELAPRAIGAAPGAAPHLFLAAALVQALAIAAFLSGRRACSPPPCGEGSGVGV